MRRTPFTTLPLAALLSGAPTLAATIDERFKALGENNLTVVDHTRDACDRDEKVTITGTVDGAVTLQPGQTRYFAIRHLHDEYGCTGGWHWKCGETSEKARIDGARYVKAIRKGNGVIDWFSVRIKHSANLDVTIPVPPGYGHYCSITAPGGWQFGNVPGTGSDPCQDMLATSPGAVIERAGLWAVAGDNNVLVNCDGEIGVLRGAGDQPIDQAFRSSQGKQHCVFTIAPTELPIFGLPYDRTRCSAPSPSSDVSVSRGFDYDVYNAPLLATDYGQPAGHPHAAGQANWIDRAGRQRCYTYVDKGVVKHADGEAAYDWPMPKGKPILAVADGVVRSARKRDVSSYADCGTDLQREIYIEHTVGSGRYAERFISYYAHMSKMSVSTGQRVLAGQKIGEAGNTGCSGGNHLHFGVLRLTNLSGQRSYNFQTTPLGYGVNGIQGVIDPFGWAAPSNIDPWALRHLGATPDTGSSASPGAFSIRLWREGQVPPWDW